MNEIINGSDVIEGNAVIEGELDLLKQRNILLWLYTELIFKINEARAEQMAEELLPAMKKEILDRLTKEQG